ncbi:MAG: HAD family hydrolase [Mycoplasmatales bacterium]|nr:HAD family hydrolase [Mycoplasmatales bacterium]
MNKKVFAFDIDGTLLDSQEKVNKAHSEIFLKAKEKGHELVLCSGRPFSDMIGVLKQMPDGLFEYAVCNNGAYIYHIPSNKILEYSTIPKEVFEKFIEIGKKIKALYAIHTDNGTRRGWLFNENEKPEWFETVFNQEWKHFECTLLSDAIEWAKDKKFFQLSLRATKELISYIRKEFDIITNMVDVHIANEYYLDINPKNVSKFVGLSKLSKIINKDISDFIAFGDSGNDLDMLKNVGLGIAMGNSTNEAKEAADIVIGHHDTTALADKMMELI